GNAPFLWERQLQVEAAGSFAEDVDRQLRTRPALHHPLPPEAVVGRRVRDPIELVGTTFEVAHLGLALAGQHLCPGQLDPDRPHRLALLSPAADMGAEEAAVLDHQRDPVAALAQWL